jgi:hypothetical protein
MKRSLGIALALTVSASLTACKPRTDEDLSEIRGAIPAAEAVRVNAPGASGKPEAGKGGLERELGAGIPAVGETAEFYAFTRNISSGLNTGAAFVLIMVRTIVAYPVTSIEGDLYIWGPWTETLNPAEYRLTVRRDLDGSYLWAFEGRRKADGPSAPFLAVVSGDAMPGAVPFHGSGEFMMDFDMAEQLDPVGNDGVGQLAVTYDLTGDPRWVTMDFETLAATPDGGQAPASFHYEYAEVSNGSGDFQFTLTADLDNNGSLWEEAAIRSRWQPTGAGRADIQISGGDAGTIVVNASECWDTGFLRSYYTDSVNWKPTEGDAGSCAFADVLLPGQ